MISWNISKRKLKLIADVSASTWHHSQGKVDKLMRRFDFYTLQSLQISILTMDRKFFKWIPLRESSLFARLGMV